MVRLVIGRVGAALAAILGWGAAGAKLVVDLLGFLTVGDSAATVQANLPQWAAWLLSTPCWVPGTLAAVLTTFLIWLSLSKPSVLAPTNESGSVSVEPSRDAIPNAGRGGRGGDASIGGSGTAIGGRGGAAGTGGQGGAGGGAHVDQGSSHSFALGGEGGEAGQLNRGGRGGRSSLALMREMGLWRDTDRPLALVTMLRHDYLALHPNGIEGSTEMDEWVNNRLAQLDVKHVIRSIQGGYEVKMI